MSEAAKGIIAIISAAMIWGLAPLYYKMLDQVPPVELLGHRTFWSLIFFTIVLWLNGRLGELRTAIFVAKEGIAIFVASLLVATNWFLFIYSIQTGQATEASLGYFILSVVSVVFGLLIFKERLSRGQVLSIGLAGCAVLILTYGLGKGPWIALTLSTTFGLYTVLKKRLKTRPMASVTLEVLFLSPFALAIFAFYHAKIGGQFGSNLEISLLLVVSGPLTATPLILFSYAAQRWQLWAYCNILIQACNFYARQ
jgi:chloramphenicol-sensitive protein RarD